MTMVIMYPHRQMKLEITASEKKLFDIIRSAADHMHAEVYVVGGFVRDRLLGIPCKDIDFVTLGDGPAFAEEVNLLRLKQRLINWQSIWEQI